MALAYLTGSVTQGGADAFAQAEIATALTGVGNVAYRVRELLFEITNAQFIHVANSSTFEIALSRRSKTAMPLVTDRDVIAKFKSGAAQLTAVGEVTRQDGVIRYTFTEDDEVLVVEDPIYLVVDGTATTLTLTVAARIGYERASISAVDRLTLLTQSLD